MIEMTLEIADRAARAALAKAAAMGIGMSVSVVDEAGRLVLTMKGDRTGFLTTDTSRAKAVAAVAFRRPTRELVAAADQSGVLGRVPRSRGEALPRPGPCRYWSTAA